MPAIKGPGQKAGFVVIANMIALFLGISIAHAQLHKPEIAESESGEQKIVYADSGKLLYTYKWTMKRFEKDGKAWIKFVGHGANTEKGDKHVTWTEESIADITDKGLQTRYWKKNSAGAEKESWVLTYNWEKHLATYSYVDHLTGKKEDKTFSFSKSALPSDTMYTLLRGFPFEKGEGYKLEGEFVLTDGSTMSGSIIHRGEEKLKTAFGTIPAYKLEMKPSGFIGVFAPTMMLWYTKSKPHVFLRFDGRDEGVLKPKTKNELIQFSPKAWIKP